MGNRVSDVNAESQRWQKPSAARLCDSVWFAALFAAALTVNVWQLAAIGATFHFDTISYFSLAEAFASGDGGAAYYAGDNGILYQQLVPGVSLVLLMAEALFGNYAWIAIAALQRLLSAAAVTYFAISLAPRLSRPLQGALVLVICAFPYFSAYHNAILTESISSSLVLFMLGLAIRASKAPAQAMRSLLLLAVLGIIAAQFRSYLGILAAALALVVIVAHRGPGVVHAVTRTAMVVMALFISLTLYPAYRYAVSGDWYLPNIDFQQIAHATWLNWEPDQRSLDILATLTDDPAVRERFRDVGFISYEDSVQIVKSLIAGGLSSQEVRTRFRAAENALRTQSLAVMANQLRLSLASVGLVWPVTCCDPDRRVRRRFIASAYDAHLRRDYLWHAALADRQYRVEFERYLSRFSEVPGLYNEASVRWLDERVKPYIRDRKRPKAQDPLRLASIPLDLIVLTGGASLLAALVLWPAVGFVLIMPVGLIGAVTLLGLGIGNTRYAHPLFPVYFGAIALALQALIVALRRSHARGRFVRPFSWRQRAS